MELSIGGGMILALSGQLSNGCILELLAVHLSRLSNGCLMELLAVHLRSCILELLSVHLTWCKAFGNLAPMQRMPVHAAVAPTCAKAGVPGATSKATSPATNEPDSPPWRKPCEGDGYELECEAEPTSPADHDQELQSMLWDALGPKVEDMVSDDKEAEPGQMAELKVKVEQEESEQDLEEEDEDHAGRARQKQKKRSRRSSRKGSKKKHKKHRKRSRSRRRRRSSSSSSSISRSRSRRRRKH